MKKSISVTVSILMSFMFIQRASSQVLIKGKFIYKNCSSVVVQVLDSNYAYLGQSFWRHSKGEPKYRNVFAVRNSCSFLKNNLTVGDEFSFVIVKDEDSNEGCTLCLDHDYIPYAKASIVVINTK